MADAENFEDDLFADLYDDNGEESSAPPAQTTSTPARGPAPSSAPAPVAAPAPVTTHVPPPVEKIPEYQPPQSSENVARGTVENAYGDDYHEEAYEEDDDVDFDLGNGPNNAPINGAAPAHAKYEDSPGPSGGYHTTRGPSAKEDGSVSVRMLAKVQQRCPS
ncbi:hypothetical protein GGS20DRAFT_26830 [Poronia punctata]|nr:hypothetical protein GGS20DRAFT_26830 [Poronia punctata]